MTLSLPLKSYLTKVIKQQAKALGFGAVGIAQARPALTHGRYIQWLEAGYGAEMTYLQRHAHLKTDPRNLLAEARSLICTAHPYPTPQANVNHKTSLPHPGGAYGHIAGYALGQDYHLILREKLGQLAVHLQQAAQQHPQTDQLGVLQWRAVVDSAPLLEREYAVRAGLGWIGKNAMLIHPKLGSQFLLATLLVSWDLIYDAPQPPRNHAPAKVQAPFGGWSVYERCGSCTACIKACPTQAIVSDKHVDSARCIAYLTIEHKGAIAPSLGQKMQQWVFGCDVCQQVCPYNRPLPVSPLGEKHAKVGTVTPQQHAHGKNAQHTTKQHAPSEENRATQGAIAAQQHLPTLLGLDAKAFKRQFGHTPLMRTKRRGVLRNAVIALGNLLAHHRLTPPQRQQAYQALQQAAGDDEPLVRQTAQQYTAALAIPPSARRE